MLWKLLVEYLQPQRRLLLAVVIFQLAQSIASLYLPTLNADIIDEGVAKGDTGYILRPGSAHAGDHAAADRLLDHGRVLRREGRHGSGPGPARRRSSPGWASSPSRRSPASGRRA